MAHYQLQLIHGGEVVSDTTVAWVPNGGSHPLVGQTVDGKWQVVEIIDFTAKIYRVRVIPICRHDGLQLTRHADGIFVCMNEHKFKEEDIQSKQRRNQGIIRKHREAVKQSNPQPR